MSTLSQKAESWKWLAPHIAQVVVVIVLIAGWKAEMDVRVRTLETRVEESKVLNEKVARVEENIKSLNAQSDRIEKKLDVVLERRR